METNWLHFDSYLACGQGGQLVVLMDHPRQMGAKGVVTRSRAPIVRFTLGSESRETLAELPGTDYYFASHVQGFADIPLGNRALAASNGALVYYAQNAEPSIHVVNLANGQRNVFRHRIERPRITAAAWSRAKAERVEREPLLRTRKLLTAVLDEAPSPKVHPPFSSMKVDRTGRLWVRLATSRPTATWKVFDSEGKHLSSIILPENVEPLDIDEEHIVAVERDSLGVETVLVYSLGAGILRR